MVRFFQFYVNCNGGYSGDVCSIRRLPTVPVTPGDVITPTVLLRLWEAWSAGTIPILLTAEPPSWARRAVIHAPMARLLTVPSLIRTLPRHHVYELRRYVYFPIITS